MIISSKLIQGTYNRTVTGEDNNFELYILIIYSQFFNAKELKQIYLKLTDIMLELCGII